MSQFVLKPGTPIEAAPYSSGLEDGFITFNSATDASNPIPQSLELVAGFWMTHTSTTWTCSIPYIAANIPLFPDDYVITPQSGPKTKKSKTAFEAVYQAYVAP